MIKLLIGLVLVLSAVFLGSNSGESQGEIVNEKNYSICLGTGADIVLMINSN